MKPKIDGLDASARSYIGWSGQALPGDPLTVRAFPQVPFRGDRFLVDSKWAPYWSLVSFQVGMNVLGASAGATPCELFTTKIDRMAELHALLVESGNGDPTKGCVRIVIDKPATELLGVALYVPVAYPGMIMQLELVQNADMWRSHVDPIPFRAGMLGDTLR
jgi:hypothetical protein